MRFAVFDAERRGDVGEIGGHLRLVDVDADADDGVVDAVGLGVHLGEDAAEFAAADEQIVGPADVRKRIQIFSGSIARGEPRDERQQRRVRGRNRRTQQDAAIDARGFFGCPGAARAAAARGLFFGEHNGAVRLAGLAKLHGDRICGVDFEEVHKCGARTACRRGDGSASAERECRARARCDSRCAGGPSPGRRAARSCSIQRHTCWRVTPISFGDLRAADHDRRVFGEQRQQRVDAPVGRAGQACGALRRHGRKQEAYMAEAASG